MGKSLVIVESPAKAKTINKYLGSQYVVKSSIGHIRDLPTSGSASTAKEPAKRGKGVAEGPALSPRDKAKRQLFARMGVDPEHGWQAHYEILPGKEKVVDELRRLAREADTIYLATDLDREGEAIAWHLRESIGGDEERYKRVVFNEITKKAIQEAFSQPATWISTGSTRSRRGASSTGWSATWFRRCSGRRSLAACPPAACSRWR